MLRAFVTGATAEGVGTIATKTIGKVLGKNKKLIDVIVSGGNLSIEGKAHSGDTEGFNHTFTINDRLDNSNYYKELDQLKNNTISEMYNNNHNNWTGD